MALGLLRFTNAIGGTADFIYPGPAIDMQSPAAAGAVNGITYLYYAQSLDMSEWEIGTGAYASASGKFARTTVTANDLGTTAKINFTNPPQVIVFDTFPATDLSAYATIAYVLANYVSATAAQSWSAAQKAQARANIGALKKNYIINGGMMVSQENGSVAGTASGYYAVDKFFFSSANTGAFSVAQVASVTPGGSPNRLRLTVTAADAAVAAGDVIVFQHRIEGYRVADLGFGSASPKTITIQFGVKAPAGTYGVAVLNSPFNRSYISEFTIAAGEANTDVVKSVTLTGDTAGTWLKDNGIGLSVSWCLMAGSTFQAAAGSWNSTNTYGTSNQFNFAGTNGNVFELFDVGLYEGSVAPAFQLPDFTSELALCQRYYVKTASGAQNYNASASVAQMAVTTPLPVTMRTAPVCTVATGVVQVSGLNFVTSYASAVPSGTWYNPASVVANARL